jgi:hypothetical protein
LFSALKVMKIAEPHTVYSTNDGLSTVNELMLSAFSKFVVTHHIRADARKPIQLHLILEGSSRALPNNTPNSYF